MTRENAGSYAAISFRFLQKGWGFEELNEKQLRSFIKSWEQRSRLTWTELSGHNRHGLGKENIPASIIRPAIPRPFTDVKTFRAYRYAGNLPVVGWRDKNVFYPIWIEPTYGELYDHGGS